MKKIHWRFWTVMRPAADYKGLKTILNRRTKIQYVELGEKDVIKFMEYVNSLVREQPEKYKDCIVFNETKKHYLISIELYNNALKDMFKDKIGALKSSS